MATSLRWRPLPLAPPLTRLPRRPILTRRLAFAPRAFHRGDFDRLAKDAWQRANLGFEQLVFEATKTAERIDRKYAVKRRFSAVAQSASFRARELQLTPKLRAFSSDLYRKWPRYREMISGFLDTPVGRSFATVFFLWFALSGWLFRSIIFATFVLPIAGPFLIGAVANNLIIRGLLFLWHQCQDVWRKNIHNFARPVSNVSQRAAYMSFFKKEKKNLEDYIFIILICSQLNTFEMLDIHTSDCCSSLNNSLIAPPSQFMLRFPNTSSPGSTLVAPASNGCGYKSQQVTRTLSSQTRADSGCNMSFAHTRQLSRLGTSRSHHCSSTSNNVSDVCIPHHHFLILILCSFGADKSGNCRC